MTAKGNTTLARVQFGLETVSGLQTLVGGRANRLAGRPALCQNATLVPLAWPAERK
jgi:hypothetical protein